MADAPSLPRDSASWLELPGNKTLVLKGDCHIGRMAGNEIVNPDPRISRRNSVLRRETGHYVLVDLGSTNGTFLNGQRIFKPARLADRDVIMVGSERYVFRQPPRETGPATDAAQSLLYRTAVSVGKNACWMVRAALDDSVLSSADSLEQLRATLSVGGARLKQLPGSVLFAHWRNDGNEPKAIVDTLRALARKESPAGARIVVHYGIVRVGPAAEPNEENLVGAEVSFTHQVAPLAARLKVKLLLTQPVVESLGLAGSVRALGEHAVSGVAGQRALFTLDV
jgi:hypothetical protein